VATFLTTQWNTIKANLKAGPNWVCAGGFIFDWCDEYWKGDPDNPNPPVTQIGGPSADFQGGAFAGGYRCRPRLPCSKRAGSSDR
jgi:hypothetical protein